VTFITHAGNGAQRLGAVCLLDDHGDTLLSIYLGGLERGGKTLLFELVRRLPGIVDRHVQPFVSGEGTT